MHRDVIVNDVIIRLCVHKNIGGFKFGDLVAHRLTAISVKPYTLISKYMVVGNSLMPYAILAEIPSKFACKGICKDITHHLLQTFQALHPSALCQPHG